MAKIKEKKRIRDKENAVDNSSINQSKIKFDSSNLFKSFLTIENKQVSKDRDTLVKVIINNPAAKRDSLNEINDEILKKLPENSILYDGEMLILHEKSKKNNYYSYIQITPTEVKCFKSIYSSSNWSDNPLIKFKINDIIALNIKKSADSYTIFYILQIQLPDKLLSIASQDKYICDNYYKILNYIKVRKIN